jgi:formamidopyrimidine-DNA glycosylase
MPELPEVETIARGVNERLRGDRIVEAWFGRHPEPFKTPAARQARGLEGRVILAVHRTGKHIVCELGAADGIELSNPSSPQQAKIARREPRSRKDQPQVLRLAALAQNDNRVEHPGAEVGHPVAGLGELESEPSAQWIVHLGMTGRLLMTTPEAPVAPHTHARLTLGSGRELRFVDPRRFGRLEFRDLGRSASFGAPGAEPISTPTRAFSGPASGRAGWLAV